METCEQANASQAAFDNLLKRIPGLPEAVEAVDHNQPPPQPEPLELAAGLGRFAIVRETTKLTKPLRPTTEPSSRLRTSHQDVIDLAIAADMTDIERLALLLSCRGEGPVADQFKREHEDWTEFDKALQPGVAIGLLGHNLGRNQPDYFYRVGQPGGLRVSITTAKHAIPRVRVSTTQASGLKISPESYGCFTVTHLEKSPIRVIKEYPLGRSRTTGLSSSSSSYEPPILGDNIADDNLFPIGLNPALLTARAVAAQHLELTQSPPRGVNIRASQPVISKALATTISDRLLRPALDPDPTVYRFTAEQNQANVVAIDFVEPELPILATVVSLFDVNRGTIEDLVQAELAASTYATAKRKGEAGIYRSMDFHEYRLKQLRDLLAKLFPVA